MPACSSDGSSPSSPPDASRTYPSPPPDPLTGFGALKAYWDYAKSPDPRYPLGVYGRADGLNTDGSGADARYTTVLDSNGGRITSYTLNFATNTPREAALQQVAAELPADAQLQWERDLPTCYQAQFRSQTLADLLPQAVLDGQVLMSFTNYGSDGSYLSELSVVDDVILMSGQGPDPADAFTC